ncbi:type I-D CRISPR-associated protein Cas5/Csc1 [Chondrinema litorale]|uniref:type I-D CRISPR-associated protein Cas5/Csc1 n=1 Tax=Chondrinema litorale TaxID=2994555 RepID=UPI002542CFD5|nr:type I-D CRISPR-associated protein Cas5/Csc1 [Chondrinema litorale]UZR99840.1 type I-D CRISPR-associated protein Cas5/Csc1 [Chondrinema litorale]
MYVYPIEITLCNHLFYFTENTNGVYTAPFIGDLALTYALRRTICTNWETPPFRKKPEYEEIKDWGFYVSVAQPIQYKHTEVYTRNTLFNVDGYIDIDNIIKSSKSPFKTLFYTQGIAVGSTFSCFIFSQKELNIPQTIRAGAGKETLLRIEEKIPNQKDVWLNIYTLQQVYKNLEKAAEWIQDEPYERAYILEQYVLLKHISLPIAERILADAFANLE